MVKKYQPITRFELPSYHIFPAISEQPNRKQREERETGNKGKGPNHFRMKKRNVYKFPSP